MDTKTLGCEASPADKPTLKQLMERRAAEPVSAELERIDRALKEDDLVRLQSRRQRNGYEETQPQSHSGAAALPTLLRVVGAIILVASAAAFMLQGWPGMDHLMRYYSFLGFTMLLTGAGFFCGLRLKEDKGARTFLATAAAIVPVHFCQLGALIYSQFPEKLVKYPAWLLWVAPSKTAAFATAIAGILALVPIIFISFSTLARAEARRLTTLYLAANTLLLIPIRSSGLVSLIALVSFLQIAAVEIVYASRQTVLRTKEGLFIRIMFALPFFLIVARTMNLYDVTLTFYSMNMATVAILFFILLPHYVSDRGTAAGLQLIAAVPAFLSWLLMACEITIHAIPRLSPYAFLLIGLPYAALLIVMSLNALDHPPVYHKTAAAVATIAICCQLLVYPSLIASIFCLVTGVFLMAYGFVSEQRSVLVAGTIGFVSGLLYHVGYAIDLYYYNPWISLAIIGVAIVLTSSVIERHHSRLTARVMALRKTFVR